MLEAGLYRHYKGTYYSVLQIAQNPEEKWEVIYFNACHPEAGMKSMLVDDFLAEVPQNDYNPNHQKQVFEKVNDLDYQLSTVSTEALIEELRHRKDSPFQEGDFNKLNSSVVYRDYIVGEKIYDKDLKLLGVDTLNSFETEERAIKHLNSRGYNRNTRLFKRVFVEL